MSTKKFYETVEFKNEQSDWYKKLEKDGFKTIESEKDTKYNCIQKQIITPDQTFNDYNRKCYEYLVKGNIEDKLDLFIFEKHCEGISNNEIAEMLKSTTLRKIDRSNIDRRINKLLQLAGIDKVEY